MFTSNSITLENSEKIIVVGKESGLTFFIALFALVFWLYIAIYNLNLFTIIVSAVIGLFTLFLFYQPKEIISELRAEIKEEAESFVIARCKEYYKQILMTGPFTTKGLGMQGDL